MKDINNGFRKANATCKDQRRDALFFLSTLKGLVKSWAGFNKMAYPSRRGYELTMRVLEQTPRSEHLLDWSALSLLRSLGGLHHPKGILEKAWSNGLHGFYDNKRLISVLQEIVNDGHVSSAVRTTSLRVLSEISDKPDFFLKMKQKVINAQHGDDYKLKLQVDTILQTWNKDHHNSL